ncbi:hypothetical protein CBM2585_A130131 [Cupriavidus taiwanensis]|nr:hypothetical protein CBM2585_A130131 [Cupriavidus taiwanensis]
MSPSPCCGQIGRLAFQCARNLLREGCNLSLRSPLVAGVVSTVCFCKNSSIYVSNLSCFVNVRAKDSTRFDIRMAERQRWILRGNGYEKTSYQHLDDGICLRTGICAKLQGWHARTHACRSQGGAGKI